MSQCIGPTAAFDEALCMPQRAAVSLIKLIAAKTLRIGSCQVGLSDGWLFSGTCLHSYRTNTLQCRPISLLGDLEDFFRIPIHRKSTSSEAPAKEGGQEVRLSLGCGLRESANYPS